MGSSTEAHVSMWKWRKDRSSVTLLKLNSMENPKVFISYSWQPKENQIRVQELAERLSSDGVHVIIDIWDLQDGQDKNQFMEQMVTNPDVNKVLLICNKNYAEKANARIGGVGTEGAIVSEEIYQHGDQTKFIPVVFEYAEDGKPYVPVFARSRIFVDLSSDDIYEDGYDKLLRDIFGKPRYQRPPIGHMPSYLEDENPVFLPTANKVKGIKNAIIAGKPCTGMLIRDYLDSFLDSLKNYKIDYRTLTDKTFIDIIEKSIDGMIPLLNDYLEFVLSIVGTSFLTKELLSDFFEQMLQTYEDNEISLYEGSYLDSLCYDNYRFFNYMLFLSVITLLLSKEQFDIVHELVSHHFCVVCKGGMRSVQEVSFIRFRTYNYTLNQYKNDRQSLNRVSLVADLMKAKTALVRFEDMVRADILLYYLSLIYPGKDQFERDWYPELSAYNRQFSILPKLASLRFFNKAKVMFNVNSVDEFKERVSSIKEPKVRDGLHNIPHIISGLSVDLVGSIK